MSCSLKRNGVSNSLESTSVLTTRHWSNHGQGTDVVKMEEALARHMAALSSIGINSMWNEWKTKFIAALDDVAPRICITKKNKRRRCPWMTPELLRVLHEQKSLFKKIKKSRKPCVEWVTQHRNLRNMYSTMYRQKKNEHFQDTFNNYRKQPREFWKTINHLTGRSKHHLPPTLTLSELVNHFSNLLYLPSAECHLPVGPVSRDGFFNFQPVTVNDVYDLLKNLKSGKSPGPDQMCPSELKMVAKTIAGTVSCLFNESLATGELPQEFKMGNVVPLLKPGKTDTSLPTNYRGITLTCILSKMLERIVGNQITAYLQQRNSLAESQYGFRKGHNCADLLTVAVDDWLLARDKKLHTAVVFIDLKKAFDNVQHQLLLLKLQQHGIGGTVLAWFWNYLSQRTQNVVLNGSSSNYFCSFKGVPQGSVLGPLLFNLYVADLPEIAQENRVALPSFADDMSLYCSRTTEMEACKDASSALSVLHQAIQDIGLEINAEKTTSMIISPHRRSQTHQQAHCSIYCKDKKVSMVTESRLLGVIVDNNLTWSAHVDTVYSKVARKIGAMKRTSRQLSLKARRSFFLSVIQPDLEYAAGACVPSMPESQRQRLLSLWRKAVRCTAGADKHADVYTICGELSITPLLHRWALSFALQVRRCYLNIAPAQLCDKLVRPCHKHSTRGNNTSLYPFRSSSLSGTVSFTNRSPILWNALQSVSGSEISTFSQSRFKKSFLDLLLVYPKFISFTVGDINSCI